MVARSGTKPGKGGYACSKCGAVQQLKTATATLKACRGCGSTLFRKARATQPAV
jgi:DNA-directed RNA polymerase subunit RPC12/RpoP